MANAPESDHDITFLQASGRCLLDDEFVMSDGRVAGIIALCGGFDEGKRCVC